MVNHIDTSYANYLRLACINLIPAPLQLVSNDWNWMTKEQKNEKIEELMKKADERDRPDAGETPW